MQHYLKIKQIYLLRLLTEVKPFEVRKNDRDYQVGDTLCFLPLDDENVNVYELYKGPKANFEITYVHSGLGMAADYVVLGIKKEVE